jgi:hypothetical protein
MAEPFEFVGKLGSNYEWLRGNKPIFLREESLFRKSFADTLNPL